MNLLQKAKQIELQNKRKTKKWEPTPDAIALVMAWFRGEVKSSSVARAFGAQSPESASLHVLKNAYKQGIIDITIKDTNADV